MLLTDSFFDAHRSSYNRLPGIDAAWRRFRALPDNTRILHGALALLHEHGASDRFGVFLLHRHFPCSRETIFLEREHQRPRKLFVTEPTPRHRAPHRMAPHRFRLDDRGRLQPLEFTTNPRAIKAQEWLSQATEMQAALAKHLKRHGVTGVLGLSSYDSGGSTSTAREWRRTCARLAGGMRCPPGAATPLESRTMRSAKRRVGPRRQTLRRDERRQGAIENPPGRRRGRGAQLAAPGPRGRRLERRSV